VCEPRTFLPGRGVPFRATAGEAFRRAFGIP
jgi:hypothetical protein